MEKDGKQNATVLGNFIFCLEVKPFIRRVRVHPVKVKTYRVVYSCRRRLDVCVLGCLYIVKLFLLKAYLTLARGYVYHGTMHTVHNIEIIYFWDLFFLLFFTLFFTFFVVTTLSPMLSLACCVAVLSRVALFACS